MMHIHTAIPSILLVEDQLLQQQQIAEELARFGYHDSRPYRSAEDALLALERKPADVILSNDRLAGDMDGAELIERVRARFEIPIVLVTGSCQRDLPDKLMDHNGIFFLPKPYLSFQLPMYVEMALSYSRS